MAYRAQCEVDIKKGSQSVYNDEKTAQQVAQAVTSVYGTQVVYTKLPNSLMGSDDFANYAQKIPSVYFMLHTNNVEKGIVETNHSPRFDLDESVLIKGVVAYVAIVSKFLNE